MEKQNLSILKVGKLMHLVIKAFNKRSEEKTHKEIKISTEQFGLLHAISKMQEEVIQKDMAEMMGKDKSAILRLIDSLEEKDLVRRVVDPKDRRKNCLMVTKLGYRVIDEYISIINELMLEIQEGLTQEEIDTFHKVVMHIITKAENF